MILIYVKPIAVVCFIIGKYNTPELYRDFDTLIGQPCLSELPEHWQLRLRFQSLILSLGVYWSFEGETCKSVPIQKYQVFWKVVDKSYATSMMWIFRFLVNRDVDNKWICFPWRWTWTKLCWIEIDTFQINVFTIVFLSIVRTCTCVLG